MSKLTISFGTKFSEAHLDNMIAIEFQKSISGEFGEVTFDCAKLEWISPEEVTFLFSWIRKLHITNIKVIIILPHPYLLAKDENEISIKRRRANNFHLLSVWGLLDKIGLNSLDFRNVVDNFNTLVERKIQAGFSKKILPFRIIDTSLRSFDSTSIDSEYDKFLIGKRVIKGTDQDEDSGDVFSLQSDLIDLLNKNECYSPFETKIISHVITKELLMNSIEHSGAEESYFTTALHDKWLNADTPNFINHYLEEKNPERISFFRDKSKIIRKIRNDIPNLSEKQKAKIGTGYSPSLERYNYFINESYLEFTYLDFGIGIPRTLEKQFLERVNDTTRPPIDDQLALINSDNHLDAKILEYAFLMESSKDPFDRHIGYSELIPRGLYFLVDMVRRYKGLLTVRSGCATVHFDFSDQIKLHNQNGIVEARLENVKLVKEAVKSNSKNVSWFPGTMMSIILPQRETAAVRKSPVRADSSFLHRIFGTRSSRDEDLFPKKIFRPERYEYMSLAFLHQEALATLPTDLINKKNGVENYIFKKIDEKLESLQNVSCVLFLDFEFLPERSNYLKIISYLSNTPKVNELTKLIITNLLEDEYKILKEFKNIILSVSKKNEVQFLFKAIPCITINKPINVRTSIRDIHWLGVRSDVDEIFLTKLFFGNIESIGVHNFEDQWVCEGNIIAVFDDFAYSVFDSFESTVNQYMEAKKLFMKSWLLTTIEDGEATEDGASKFVFLTSKGSFQHRYISLYETLHYKYLADFFAKFLLDTYISNQISVREWELQTKFEELSVYDQESILQSIGFEKIVVVTVSSQLLGVSIRNLIKTNKNYSFLLAANSTSMSDSTSTESLPRRTVTNRDCPEIIRLSSYFSFDTEKPYENIMSAERVLIVNDVISTGSLIKRLIDGIKQKKANLVGILTIADSRGIDEVGPDHYKSYKFDESVESNLISIVSSDVNSEFIIKKMITKPEGGHFIKRINPILNSVVELKSHHSEKTRIIFDDPAEIIETEIFDNNLFQIGHFKQNLSHNSYFTDMAKLFNGENGHRLLAKLKKKIESDSALLMVSDIDTIKHNLYNAAQNLESLDRIADFGNLSERIEDISATLKDLSHILDSRDTGGSNSLERKYEPDFIFYPVFSGIEEVDDHTFSEIFSTKVENIIGLQRYETRNGWRFPFPAKRFNKITQKKHVLIVDSGALSGHSLVQLVDSISFLEVGRIDFLTIVGRIDDFHREFYSRIKSIKVKNLKRHDDTDKRESIVSLNLLFGINLHIPSYVSEDVCPYCKEMKTLKGYQRISENSPLPHETQEYIKRRLIEISLVSNYDSNIFPDYLPLLREDKIPDYPRIFLMRDRLGKVDSYRFYHDYFQFFDEISELYESRPIEQRVELLKNFELILVCILHEPVLFTVVKDLLVNVHFSLDGLIDQIVFYRKLDISSLYYFWPRYSLIRIAVIFRSSLSEEDPRYLYREEVFANLFIFAKDDARSLNYLSFLIAEHYHKLLPLQSKTINVESILEYLFFRSDEFDLRVNRIVVSFTRNYKLSRAKSVHEALKNLKNFYIKEDSLDRHSVLENALSIIDSGVNNPKLIPQKLTTLGDAISLVREILEDDILANLNTLFQSEHLSRCYESSYKQIFGDGKVFARLVDILEQHNSLASLQEEAEEYILRVENISVELSNFQMDFLFERRENFFRTFCLRYRSNLGSCIDSVYKKFEHRKCSNLTIYYEVDELQYFVSMHEDFLRSAVLEIMMNANTFATSYEKSLKLFISARVQKWNRILLSFFQNAPFMNPNGVKSGTDAVIRLAFETFCYDGSFHVSVLPNYIIEAILPVE